MPSYEEKTKALVSSLINAGTLDEKVLDEARKAQEKKAKEAKDKAK
jgi:hypothetical protein